MRQAFINAASNAIANTAQLSDKLANILTAIVRNATKPEPKFAGWSAKLSYDTARKLNAPVYDFKHQPRMRYDDMLNA